MNVPPARLSSEDRQHGIDLLRAIAALAVVLIHTPDKLGDGMAVAVREALPNPNALFALMAGYFMAGKALAPPVAWLKRRAARLLAPYAAWTVIYVLLNVTHHWICHEPQIFVGWRGWLRVVLFGGGGVQLWFLVFLFYAQCVLYPMLRWMQPAQRRPDAVPRGTCCRGLPGWLQPLGFAGLAAVAIGLSSLHAEAPAWKLCFMAGYVALGIAVKLALPGRPAAGPRRMGPAIAALLAAAAMACSLGVARVPDTGIVMLWFAAGLCYGSTRVPRFVTAIGAASMGIYLAHVIFTTILPMLATVLAGHIPALGWLRASLLVGVSAFLVSWFVVVLMKRNRWLAALVD